MTLIDEVRAHPESAVAALLATINHGTAYAYQKRKCTCEQCKAANAAVVRKQAERRREKKPRATYWIICAHCNKAAEVRVKTQKHCNTECHIAGMAGKQRGPFKNSLKPKPTVAAPVSGGCVHHWIIEMPVNGIQRGECKKCHAVREFYPFAEDGEQSRRALVLARKAGS